MKKYEVCSITCLGGTEVIGEVEADTLILAAAEAAKNEKWRPTYEGEDVIVRTCYFDWLKNGQTREKTPEGYEHVDVTTWPEVQVKEAAKDILGLVLLGADDIDPKVLGAVETRLTKLVAAVLA